MRSYDEYKELVNNNLLQYIPSIDDKAKVLRDSMEYSLKVGGKRVRPVLLLAACEFAGGDIHEAMPYACAIEYIHTYSLIHDDLPCMDNDDLRRGQPTNHKVYGEDIATLAGDGLLNSAAELMYSELIKCDDAVKIKKHAAAAYEIMSRSGVRGMIGGQVADVINENKKGTKELVQFIEKHKTGDLITAGVLAGLAIAGADGDAKKNFEEYSMSIGIAFQVLDDILDFEGDAELMGKTLGKDLDQDKCNYVCVHGLEAAKEELHRLTEYAISSLDSYNENAEFFRQFATRLEKRNK